MLYLLFAATLAAIFFLKPHQTGRVEKKGVPQIMFIDFRSFEITEKGILSVGRGLVAEKFPQFMKIKSPYFKRLTPQGRESIKAKEAVYNEDGTLLFERSVVLKLEEGWQIDTEKTYFDLKRKVYSTAGLPFTARYGESVVRGKNMFYYQKSGKITADSIKADIATEDI